MAIRYAFCETSYELEAFHVENHHACMYVHLLAYTCVVRISTNCWVRNSAKRLLSVNILATIGGLSCFHFQFFVSEIVRRSLSASPQSLLGLHEWDAGKFSHTWNTLNEVACEIAFVCVSGSISIDGVARLAQEYFAFYWYSFTSSRERPSISFLYRDRIMNEIAVARQKRERKFRKFNTSRETTTHRRFREGYIRIGETS